MTHYTKLELLNYLKTLKASITYKKEQGVKIAYYELVASFDIETSSTEIGGEKFAFMYEWTFGIEDYICYGRNWSEFIELCETIQQFFNTNPSTRLVIYVHNLSYEFQFMYKLFEWNSVFASDIRKPIKTLSKLGLEFRCSYILSGLNLALTAKNLTTYKIDKMVGDLDYSKLRTPLTPLTDKELRYCEYDVKIVICYIREQIDEYKSITKIPLTNTGRVRQYVRNNCLYSNNNHKRANAGKYSNFRDLMENLTLTAKTYKLCKLVFQGGFTHANYDKVGEVWENVHSIDFTSSYPAVMLSEKYPMSTPKEITDVSRESMEARFKKKNFCYMFFARFTNITSKRTECYLSESKCFEKVKPVTNNGRIFSAESLLTAITNVDYEIIKACYDFDDVEFSNVYEMYCEYLPKPIITSILDLYEKKTTLKGVAGMESEYLKSKGMLNSVYGMSVTDIVQEEHTLENNVWITKESDTNEKIMEYNTSKNRFLFYPWGIFVTAYARRNLWSGILAIGDDYIYSDTDSIKFLNYEVHKEYIERYNKHITAKLKAMCDYYKIPYTAISPKTNKGVLKPLGVWDYEGEYKYFKTLGAKRYMYYDTDLHITIAGLSKSQGVDYIKSQCKSVREMFDFFNTNMFIPAEGTGKKTHTYIDECKEYEITDYLGNTSVIKSESAIHLSDCEFTLSLSKEYTRFLSLFVEGYVLRGTTYV